MIQTIQDKAPKGATHYQVALLPKTDPEGQHNPRGAGRPSWMNNAETKEPYTLEEDPDLEPGTYLVQYLRCLNPPPPPPDDEAEAEEADSELTPPRPLLRYQRLGKLQLQLEVEGDAVGDPPPPPTEPPSPPQDAHGRVVDGALDVASVGQKIGVHGVSELRLLIGRLRTQIDEAEERNAELEAKINELTDEKIALVKKLTGKFEELADKASLQAAPPQEPLAVGVLREVRLGLGNVFGPLAPGMVARLLPAPTTWPPRAKELLTELAAGLGRVPPDLRPLCMELCRLAEVLPQDKAS